MFCLCSMLLCMVCCFGFLRVASFLYYVFCFVVSICVLLYFAVRCFRIALRCSVALFPVLCNASLCWSCLSVLCFAPACFEFLCSASFYVFLYFALCWLALGPLRFALEPKQRKAKQCNANRSKAMQVGNSEFCQPRRRHQATELGGPG